MTQPAFQVDQLRVDPSSGDPLFVRRGSDGSLVFTDALVPAGLRLSDLAGIRDVDGVRVVGRGGAGAQYTSVQAALDSIPTSSGPTAPHLVLVLPGVYAEDLLVTKDAVTICGLGGVVLRPATNRHTVIVTSSVSTNPLTFTLSGVTVLQANDGKACVAFIGGSGSPVGSGALTLYNCDLLPSGVGCYTVYGDTVGNIAVRSCRTTGVPPSTSLTLTQCASLLVHGGSIPALQIGYSTLQPLSATAVGAYTISDCTTVGNVLLEAPSTVPCTLWGCARTGTVTLNGTTVLSVGASTTGALTLNGTTVANLVGSSRGSASGSGVLGEGLTSGVANVTAADHVDVVLLVARASSNYGVVLDAGSANTPWATNKTTTGFRVQFATTVTVTVVWTVIGG